MQPPAETATPVYVDDLLAWPGRRVGPFGGGRKSCHLFAADLGAEALLALHALAARIGLRRGWFQPLSYPHYDLTPERRAAAIAAGAVPLGRKEAVAVRRRARAAGGEPGPC